MDTTEAFTDPDARPGVRSPFTDIRFCGPHQTPRKHRAKVTVDEKFSDATEVDDAESSDEEHEEPNDFFYISSHILALHSSRIITLQSAVKTQDHTEIMTLSLPVSFGYIHGFFKALLLSEPLFHERLTLHRALNYLYIVLVLVCKRLFTQGLDCIMNLLKLPETTVSLKVLRRVPSAICESQNLTLQTLYTELLQKHIENVDKHMLFKVSYDKCSRSLLRRLLELRSGIATFEQVYSRYVAAKDSINIWRLAVKLEEKNGKTKVHYVGWHERWDDWVDNVTHLRPVYMNGAYFCFSNLCNTYHNSAVYMYRHIKNGKNRPPCSILTS